MILKDLLNTTCTRCKSGKLIELSLTYTARVECSHCRAVFNRLVHANG
ncbi:hypothetical protein phiPsa267_095 [Pseudomonas phage phiPsa267]|jgi:hypothetical protein|uniref:Uncharacterized protein n=11 Tax=Otagovirus TaxID=2560197 RepID=A0A7G9V168_9CAUD|nr:hypothetical protein CF96_gp130 [Pseudomonas phage phiPsa374]YP_010766824.1 hypothetical protein QGX14_gp137 [Pseudomonas phage psageK4]YP_010767013.1 hypothetical protein QGX15_gp139 [Pseudomonas phage psageK4e]YP_010767185.1 hypothetical protein QGX16_gp130 [Pseudomonas phage phiPsa397]YP_010767355.1 hypothetical protein QGX17_gp132 [Pseudomonas phage phiPsa381]YP_010767531.1 hypothetical protein QGX18_gp133 [Pseudomonas phage phiPsa347]YP_010767705.1 hypothetical protein QGX19_gp135 [Ps